MPQGLLRGNRSRSAVMGPAAGRRRFQTFPPSARNGEVRPQSRRSFISREMTANGVGRHYFANDKAVHDRVEMKSSLIEHATGYSMRASWCRLRRTHAAGSQVDGWG